MNDQIEEANSILKSSEQDKPTSFAVPTNVAEKILFTLDRHRQIVRDSRGNLQHFPPFMIESANKYAHHPDSTLSTAIKEFSSGIERHRNDPSATLQLNSRQVTEIGRILSGMAVSASSRSHRKVEEHELSQQLQVLTNSFVNAGGKLTQ